MKRKFPWETDDEQPKKKMRCISPSGLPYERCQNCEGISITFKIPYPHWKYHSGGSPKEFSKFIWICKNCYSLFVQHDAFKGRSTTSGILPHGIKHYRADATFRAVVEKEEEEPGGLRRRMPWGSVKHMRR